jgi:hypothetical protein
MTLLLRKLTNFLSYVPCSGKLLRALIYCPIRKLLVTNSGNTTSHTKIKDWTIPMRESKH